MAPTTDTEVEIPEDLYKAFSKAAATNGRAMEEETIARLRSSFGIDDMAETKQQH